MTVYDHALKVLLKEYKRLKKNTGSGNQKKAQSVRQGIEYLCRPYQRKIGDRSIIRSKAGVVPVTKTRTPLENT